jgi:zinc protease
MFAVYMATSPEKQKTAIHGMAEQVRRIREEKIPEEEIERAKNYLIGTYEVGIQTNSAQASAMAFNELYGLGYAAYREYPNRIKKVTAKDVRKAAEKYLCPDCLVEAKVVPEKN